MMNVKWYFKEQQKSYQYSIIILSIEFEAFEVRLLLRIPHKWGNKIHSWGAESFFAIKSKFIAAMPEKKENFFDLSSICVGNKFPIILISKSS